MKRTVRWVLAVLLAFVALAFLNNTSLLAPAGGGRPTLLAHRGLAQTFSAEDLKGDTCTSERIDPPEHPYLENTLASMEAAFRLGADIVEFDVHPTRDDQFAVFHDWTLACRTNGKGVTREHTLAELKALDVGHGYTADAGKTYPFRGRGIGLMPSLDDVLGGFADRRFLIHVKSNDPAEGELLARHLARLPPRQLSLLIVYGGDRPIEVLRRVLPALRVMSRASLKGCMLRYFAVGWSGYVPHLCRHSMLLVPANYAAWVWGWPQRFVARIQAVGTEVFLLGPWSSGEFSRGLDDAASYGALPIGYSGGIWTNRIDRIAPLAGARR